MDIRNYDEITAEMDGDTLPEAININLFAPHHPFRLLIIGPTGQGKTNLLLNLLTEYIYYDKLYVYAKTVDAEDKYLWLKKHLEEVTEIAQNKALETSIANKTMLDTENIATDFNIIGGWSSDLDEMITVDDLDENKQNLMVFDDMTLESKINHTKISEHFIRGRKKNCSYIYIGHSFFLVPKLIRINISDLILFPPDNKREIQELAKTYASRIEFKEFQTLLNTVRDPNNNEGHDFIYIDTRAKNINKWIRRGFDEFYTQN